MIWSSSSILYNFLTVIWYILLSSMLHSSQNVFIPTKQWLNIHKCRRKTSIKDYNHLTCSSQTFTPFAWSLCKSSWPWLHIKDTSISSWEFVWLSWCNMKTIKPRDKFDTSSPDPFMLSSWLVVSPSILHLHPIFHVPLLD